MDKDLTKHRDGLMIGMYTQTVAMIISVGLTTSVAGATPNAMPNIVQGEAVYQRCVGCHSLEVNRTGPSHCHILGRRAGSVPDFAYSKAMQESGITWTEQTLDTFLAAPLQMVPGTTMGISGIGSPHERQSLIAYLKYAAEELCQKNAPD